MNRCAHAHPRSRSGSLLVVVAGVAALLLSMTMVFLVRMRTGAEEADAAVRETSAHLMLVAACNYIQEASRLGWDDPGTAQHEEGFGWIDVRDGGIGPKDQNGNLPAAYAGSWLDLSVPLATRKSARCPMYVMRRPPFAICPVAAPNPIASSGANKGMPYVANPDPIPAVHPVAANLPAVPLTPTEWQQYASGDRTPLQNGQEPTWFRLFRDGPASFVVTAGCGGTMGWKAWGEIPTADRTAFNGDQAFWQSMRESEALLWYRVEWSPAVAVPDYYNINNDFAISGSFAADHYFQSSMNWSMGVRNQGHNVNMGGTIRYVQRLMQEPTYW
jgi:hypothetical protein